MKNNVPQNYNKGVKRKGRKPNFRLLRLSEQAIQKDRNEKGIYFTPKHSLDENNYIANEFSKDLVNDNKEQLINRNCLLNIRNTITNEYYHQPYILGKNEPVIRNDNGTLSLKKLPRINHKKVSKLVKDNPNSFEIMLTRVGEFETFKELCDFDASLYNNNDNRLCYNRNMDYKKIFGDLYFDPKEVKTESVPTTFDEDETLVPSDYKKSLFIIINKTIGKIQYVPQTRFTSLEQFVNDWGSVELKRTFSRGDKFEVLQYDIIDKDTYVKYAFKSKYARGFRRLDLNKNTFDRQNVLDMYEDYTTRVNELYDCSKFERSSITKHLNIVYRHINNYLKDINPNKQERQYSCLERFILASFSEQEFKQSWHNVLFHEIVTDQKMFLNEIGLGRILLEFSGHSIRVTTEDQRRGDITKASALLDGSSSLQLYTSINKIFHGISRREPSNRESVASVADVKRGSQTDNQSVSVVNSQGSYAHSKGFSFDEREINDDYISSLLSYVESDSYFDIDEDSRWAD